MSASKRRNWETVQNAVSHINSAYNQSYKVKMGKGYRGCVLTNGEEVTEFSTFASAFDHLFDVMGDLLREKENTKSTLTGVVS